MIRSSLEHGVRVICLCRSQKRNALTPQMLAELGDAFRKPAEAGSILLCGEGEGFCAGFDLSGCRDDARVLPELLSGLSQVVGLMKSNGVPVIVAAHAMAIAGGCALLGGADLVVTNATAKLGYPVVRLGISPAVSVPYLRMSVGDGAARARVLDPGLIDGHRAVELGLAHECVDHANEVVARAVGLAQLLASKPAGAMRATREWLDEVAPVLHAGSGLTVSLGLVGGPEERALLPQVWTKS